MNDLAQFGSDEERTQILKVLRQTENNFKFLDVGEDYLRDVEDRFKLFELASHQHHFNVRGGVTFHVETCIFFTIKYRAAAFKAYYAIRSFITFHGIFMAHGYHRGGVPFGKVVTNGRSGPFF